MKRNFGTEHFGRIWSALRHAPALLRGMHPAREWALGLLFMLPVFVMGVAYAGYRFWDMKDRVEHPQSAEVETAVYKHEEVDEVLNVYRARLRTLEAAIGGPVFDPDALPPAPVETETPVAEEGEEPVE